MKSILSLAGWFLIQSVPCEHRECGTSIAVDLDGIGKAYQEAARGLEMAIESARVTDPLAGPFDSKLPACRNRETRRCQVGPVPAELVGKQIYFGTIRKGDLWVATSARQLRDLAGAVPASRELADRLGIRCVPAMATVRSQTEVEIVEE